MQRHSAGVFRIRPRREARRAANSSTAATSPVRKPWPGNRLLERHPSRLLDPERPTRVLIPSRRTRALLPLVLLLEVGCGSPDDRSSTSPADAGRADTVARSDLAREEQAIREAEGRWREMMRRKDTAAIGSFYTEDAIYAPEDRPPARGRDAVAAMRATHELTLGDVMLERTPSRIDVARSGDVATEVGTWVFRGTRPDDKRFEGRGNYLTAWRKEGGAWKTSAYLWNFGETGRARR